MSYAIKGRKMKEDGRSAGYLLLQYGMPVILEERDLYHSDIINGLIESGYKYHDYYGVITTDEGTQIKDLPMLEPAADDNYSFAGTFAQDALTEQQCLRYFTVSMDIKEIEMHSPIRILINTREELIAYLTSFKTYHNTLNSIDTALPINAITAKEALFTVEELEQNPELKKYFEYMAKRRKIMSMGRVKMLEDEFIAVGLMTEEQRGNSDAFLLAYTAFGPDGLQDPVVGKMLERDVAYSINTPYTGTGREKNTFDAEVVRIRREGIEASIPVLMTSSVYALMDKKGNFTYNGVVYPRADVAGGTTRLYISSHDSAKAKELLREANSWRTPYRLVSCTYAKPLSRVSMVVQLSGGQLYEWRCDMENMALVSNTGLVYKEQFISVMVADGYVEPLHRVYSKEDHDSLTIFRSLAKEFLNSVKEQPLFENTLKMCEYCGLNVEQTLDYVEAKSGRWGASGLLRNELDPILVKEFGGGLEDLPEDAPMVDKLEVILSNYNMQSELPVGDPNRINFAELEESSTVSEGREKELYEYHRQNRPMERIEAITSLSTNFKRLDQAEGEKNDIKNAPTGKVTECLNTMFLTKYGTMYDSLGNIKSNELFEFITSIRTGDMDIAPINQAFENIVNEANGCMSDYARLRYEQVMNTKMSAYVTGVVAEVSGDVMENRRHFAFVGKRLDHTSEVIKNIFNQNQKIIDSVVDTTLIYKTSNKTTAKRLGVEHILKMIWRLLGEPSSMKYNGESYTCTVKYRAPEHAVIEAALVITKAQFEKIKEGDGILKDFACTMEDWCRKSFIVNDGTISTECVLVNAKVDPWYITPISNAESFKVFNGQINLSPADFIDVTLRKKYPGVYEEVLKGGCLAPVGVESDYWESSLFPVTSLEKSLMAADRVSFRVINEEKGRGKDNISLPMESKDFFLSDIRYESARDYYARIKLERSLLTKDADRKFIRVPLKNDIYYKEIMPMYGYGFPQSVVTAPKTDPVHFLEPARAYSTSSVRRLAVKLNQIYSVSFGAAELVGLPKYLSYGFEPRLRYFIESDRIRTEAGVLDLSAATENVMDKLVSEGNAMQIGSCKYMLVGINKRVILEVV